MRALAMLWLVGPFVAAWTMGATGWALFPPALVVTNIWLGARCAGQIAHTPWL